MIQQRPITLPPKFARQLLEDFYGWSGELPDLTDSEKFFTTKAAQWGYEQGRAISEAELQKARDEEMEACCDWLTTGPYGACIAIKPGCSNLIADQLRAARRPKPKSLAEQKQAIHDEIHQLLAQISANNAGALAVAESIRRALERHLRELERVNE